METVRTKETTITYEEKDGKIMVCYHSSPEVCQVLDSEDAIRGFKLYLAHLWDTGQILPEGRHD